MSGINRFYYWKKKPHETQTKFCASLEVGQMIVYINDYSEASFKYFAENMEKAGLVVDWSSERTKLMFTLPHDNRPKLCTVYEGIVVAKHNPPAPKKCAWDHALGDTDFSDTAIGFGCGL